MFMFKFLLKFLVGIFILYYAVDWLIKNNETIRGFLGFLNLL